MTTPPTHGLISGTLTEVYSNRIVVGTHTLFLRDSEVCRYETGSALEAFFTAQDGRWTVKSITLLRERPR